MKVSLKAKACLIINMNLLLSIIQDLKYLVAPFFSIVLGSG